MATRKIIFEFDDKSLGQLREVAWRGKFSSLGQAVREAVKLMLGFQKQAADGFTEVTVRNPKTGATRVASLPSLSISRSLSPLGQARLKKLSQAHVAHEAEAKSQPPKTAPKSEPGKQN